ncbi:MAG: ribosomal protein S18-alanine N-acetyltransferase [Clostridia bacterium]|nr:ribosomal protein S18-alanine N-acetyltransferase [Clostridia bacterium]
MMQKIDFTVTPAELSDAHGISMIEKECFSAPWSESQIKDEISKLGVIFLTAKSADELCGYISGQLILDEFYINNVAVTEKFRKHGIASALIGQLIDTLKETTCSLITLEVRESNEDARRLYEKFGFKNLGIRKDFYSRPKENACIYTLYFNEGECEN